MGRAPALSPEPGAGEREDTPGPATEGPGDTPANPDDGLVGDDETDDLALDPTTTEQLEAERVAPSMDPWPVRLGFESRRDRPAEGAGAGGSLFLGILSLLIDPTFNKSSTLKGRAQ